MTTAGAGPAAGASALAAATVVVLRDGGSGVEVLLVQRHGQSPFMPGATVFPGGKIDAADAEAGLALATGDTALGAFDAAPAAAARVAAVRELHEEAHLLLARDHAARPVEAAVVARLDTLVERARDGRRLRSADWHAAVTELGLAVDSEAVVPFAHWLTPAAEPRRFDTVFFATLLPHGQTASLDRHETTALRWMRPADALAGHLAGGDLLLPPPTLHTLQRLDTLGLAHGRAQAVLEALATEGVGPRIQPWFTLQEGGGPAIALPWDPLHPECAAYCDRHGAALGQMTAVRGPAGAQLDRFVLRAGRFHRIHA